MRDIFLTSTWVALGTIALRVIVAYLVLLIVLRIMGYREFGRLSALDMIVAFMFAMIAATSFTNLATPFIYSLFALCLIALIHFAIRIIGLWWPRFQQFIQGKPVILIKDGKILEKNLRKVYLNHDDLLMELRLKNIPRVADVEFAILEPVGKISAIKKPTQTPVTASDLGIKKAQPGIPLPVIVNGEILRDNLKALGFDETWLTMELAKYGAYRLDQISFAQVDAEGHLYVDLYNDQFPQPQNIEKPYLLANLKKIASDLQLFSLQTEHKQAKAQYNQMSQKVNQMIEELEPYLKED
jgi:uncharacterized membrane protein YcaP (DUF421 family)